MLSFHRTFYLALTLATTGALAAINGPCTVGSTPGVCIATAQCSSASGTSSVGFCPNDPTGIKCCTKPSCGVGGHCGWADSCKGTTKAGLCPGPADFNCCFPASTGGGAHSLSPNGVNFIAGFEGFRKDFYIDAAVSFPHLPPSCPFLLPRDVSMLHISSFSTPVSGCGFSPSIWILILVFVSTIGSENDWIRSRVSAVIGL